VPDRINVLAWALPPVFFLVNRLWGWLALYGVALGLALLLNKAVPGLGFVVLSGAGILTGLEAAQMIGRNLSRRGFREAGFVVGATQEEAEIRYFNRRPSARVAPLPAAAVTPRPAGPAIIGFGNLAR
jgi:hypothetical protein